MIHPEISGNKFWKLLYNVENYLSQKPKNTQIITFGGAFSNHIFAVSALGKVLKTDTMGVIRGDELEGNWQTNPTLSKACQNGMKFRFISRTDYRDKEKLTQNLQQEFPEALIIPEGGTNELAVEGIKFMLSEETKEFDYLCCAVGTGGTIAGISKFAEDNQKVLGFTVVKDDSLESKILQFSQKENFQLFDASDGGYGRVTTENVEFINEFFSKYKIPLEPIYTGKMFRNIIELIDKDFFPANSKILAFHTGGLQGIAGINDKLKKQGKELINLSASPTK